MDMEERMQVLEDRESIKELMALDGIARFEDNAPLWDYQDVALQKSVDQALVDLGLDDEASKKQLSMGNDDPL